MATVKEKVKITVKEQGSDKEIASFGTQTLTDAFAKIPKGQTVDFFCKEPAFEQTFIGNYPIKGLTDTPPKPDPIDPNKPPAVQAGADIQVKTGVEVTLDGTAVDLDGTIKDVIWTQISGTEVRLFTDAGDNTKVTFTAPQILAGSEVLEFVFRATDDKGASAVDAMRVTVTNDTVPPVPPVPTAQLWTSKSWTFDGPAVKLPVGSKNWIVGGSASGWIAPFDPDKVTVLSHAGTSGPAEFDGKGNVTLHGDQSRIYLRIKNFNSKMKLKLIPHFKAADDDCSLKLLSRHNQGGAPENRFGGEGFALGPSTWDSKREDYHNVHTKLGGGSLKQKLVNEKEYPIEFAVTHEGGKIHLVASVDYGNGFVKECDVFDSKPLASATNEAKYNEESYVWIRNNGAGSITVRDVSVEKV